MKKLLILFLAMAAVGCKEGGILNDHNVFMSDSLASAVKKVPIWFEASMPMYVTDVYENARTSLDCQWRHSARNN